MIEQRVRERLYDHLGQRDVPGDTVLEMPMTLRGTYCSTSTALSAGAATGDRHTRGRNQNRHAQKPPTKPAVAVPAEVRVELTG